MPTGIVAATLLLAVLGAPAAAHGFDADRGWGYLIGKLERDGIPRERAECIFRDSRVEPFDGLQFSLHPRESPALYRRLRAPATVTRARSCRDRWASELTAAEREYGVPSSLVAAIVQVESGCGQNTGRSRILPALARLAMASEPRNLERNIERHTLFANTGSLLSASRWTRWRAQVLEDMFYPEVKATFEVAGRLRVDPLEMRGSGSGAFGIPQFLPTSYLWYGIDGDGDGHVSLYHAEDAIPSCAHYLQQYGWRSGLTRREQRNVIWGYNHSDAYIDTVLWLRDEVVSPSPAPVVTARAKRRTTKARSVKSRKKTVRVPAAKRPAKPATRRPS